jgi:hypothetical protein
MSSSLRPRLVIAALVAAGAVVCAAWILSERFLFFYYWDFGWYENETIKIADLFRQSPRQALQEINRSMALRYNDLFTLPLIPWVLVFGEQRLVFILAVYFTYFVPYLLLIARIARRAVPDRPGVAGCMAVLLALATPACWSHVVQGYPDIVGAALMVGCVLLYRRWLGPLPILRPLALGALAALSILLRRHYPYAVAALFAALFADGMLDAWAGRREGVAFSRLSRHLTGFVLAVFGAVGTLGYFDADFVSRAFETQPQLGAWQLTLWRTAVSIVTTVGAVPLLLAVCGWWWRWRVIGLEEPALRVPFLATIAWTAIWIGHSRQPPFHYPHWLPLFVVLGLLLAWVQAKDVSWSMGRRVIRATVLTVAMAAAVLSSPLLAGDVPRIHALRLFPARVQRPTMPAFAIIADLVGFLRAEAKPDDVVLVAGASATLSANTLGAAEIALHGRDSTRLHIMTTAVVDADGELPTEALLHATLVVVGEPTEYELPPSHQKVVSVLVDAFRERWPISQDFEVLPRRFSIAASGAEIRVYRRRSPSSVDHAVDAARRIERAVTGVESAVPLWAVQSPVDWGVTYRTDGTARAKIHPTPASWRHATSLHPLGFSAAGARLSGTVWVEDSRCKGVEILALVEGEEQRALSLGVFTSRAGKAALDTALPHLRDRRFALEVHGSPVDRENTDYCTTMLTDLRVRALP